MKTTTISLRVPEDLKDLLAIVSKKESRNLTLQIKYFIKSGLQRYIQDYPELKTNYKSVFKENP